MRVAQEPATRATRSASTFFDVTLARTDARVLGRRIARVDLPPWRDYSCQIMFGTIVNCLAIVVGSLLGLTIARRIPDSYRDSVFNGIGVVSLVIGFSMAFKSNNVIYLAVALIVGGLLGTRLDIEGAILRLGAFLSRVSTRRAMAEPVEKTDTEGPQGWNFAHGFLNASVLFCVGAMSLIGSFKAGTEGDYSLLFTKSVLDGFMSILMTAAMGPGVLFSALPVLVYQGLLTLGASFIKPYVSPLMLAELTGTGGALIVMIGINILALKKIKTADFLPALVVTAFLVLADPLVVAIASALGL